MTYVFLSQLHLVILLISLLSATELKIGFESAIITKVDEHTFATEKFNYSMSGMLLYALYVAATTGDWKGVPATAMRG